MTRHIKIRSLFSQTTAGRAQICAVEHGAKAREQKSSF